jgi:hypothetical protein
MPRWASAPVSATPPMPPPMTPTRNALAMMFSSFSFLWRRRAMAAAPY